MIVFIFLGMCVAPGDLLADNSFLKPQNLINVVRQISVIGLLALGVTVAIISTGIDLSLGFGARRVAAVVAASFVQQPDWKEAIYPGLQHAGDSSASWPESASGSSLGFVNGALIAFTRIPPFIATLGMMQIARGLAYIYSDGRPVSTLNDDFLFIGQGEPARHAGADPRVRARRRPRPHHARLHALRPPRVRDRRQRDGSPRLGRQPRTGPRC